MANQFEDKLFHSEMHIRQIGARNKTVVVYQFKYRNSEQKVLNDQFGNNVFHLRMGTRNKTVLIYYFGNTTFHLKIEINSEQNSPK